eukprot:9898407-Lingulodinium_polyedra.AAC.1
MSRPQLDAAVLPAGVGAGAGFAAFCFRRPGVRRPRAPVVPRPVGPGPCLAGRLVPGGRTDVAP